MGKYFDKDFWKMFTAFLGVVILALISFYLLNYLRDNSQTANVIISFFDKIIH